MNITLIQINYYPSEEFKSIKKGQKTRLAVMSCDRNRLEKKTLFLCQFFAAISRAL